MKRFASLVLVALVSVAVSFAADPKPLVQAGNKAVLFDLGGLANLAVGNYGGGLGAKYYVAQDLAIRLSIGFTTSTTTDKNTQSPLPANRLAESKLTSSTFTIGPAVTYNVAKVSTVVAYVGGMFTYNSASDKREGNSLGLGINYNAGESYKESSSGFGVAAIFGVEWFPWENISFSGEYRLGYVNTSSTVESATSAASTSTDGPSTSGFGLGSANSAALTLSVYF